VLRNALGDADDKIQLSLHGFHDGGGSERRRNVDDGGVGLGFRLGFSDGVEDGKAQVFGSTLLRSHTTNLSCQKLGLADAKVCMRWWS